MTEVTPFSMFYLAEAYHQDYFRNNPNQGYCQAAINPKVAKFITTRIDSRAAKSHPFKSLATIVAIACKTRFREVTRHRRIAPCFSARITPLVADSPKVCSSL